MTARKRIVQLATTIVATLGLVVTPALIGFNAAFAEEDPVPLAETEENLEEPGDEEGPGGLDDSEGGDLNLPGEDGGSDGSNEDEDSNGTGGGLDLGPSNSGDEDAPQIASLMTASGVSCDSVRLTGSAKVGGKVTAVLPKGCDKADAEYKWSSGANELPDETEPTISVKPDYADKFLMVKVTVGDKTFTKSTKAEVRKGNITKDDVSITGTRQVGKTLTVKPGSWTPTPDYSYQWYQRAKGGKWVRIKGATGNSYTLKAAQRGKSIRVEVRGARTGYVTAKDTTKAVGPIKAGKLLNPKPKLRGSAKVGKTITVKTGKATKGTKFTYRWYADGKRFAKTKSPKRKMKQAQAGKRITVKVTRSKAGYKTVSKTSNASKVVKGVGLVKGTVSFKGSIAPGNVLTANPGQWTKGTKLSYQWQACGQNISGATGRTHVMKSNNVNCRIRVKVTGSQPGFKSVSKNSKSKGIRWRISTGKQPKLSNYKNLSVTVSIPKQRVYVKSNGKTIYTMLTSTGVAGHGTPRGTYRISDRGPQFMLSYGIGARYWVRIRGAILFHSIPIYRDGTYIPSMGARLGQKASQGCVRLSVSDSIWFYNQIPSGTKVRVV